MACPQESIDLQGRREWLTLPREPLEQSYFESLAYWRAQCTSMHWLKPRQASVEGAIVFNRWQATLWVLAKSTNLEALYSAAP